jgi:hypothetical protein
MGALIISFSPLILCYLVLVCCICTGLNLANFKIEIIENDLLNGILKFEFCS